MTTTNRMPQRGTARVGDGRPGAIQPENLGRLCPAVEGKSIDDIDTDSNNADSKVVKGCGHKLPDLLRLANVRQILCQVGTCALYIAAGHRVRPARQLRTITSHKLIAIALIVGGGDRWSVACAHHANARFNGLRVITNTRRKYH
ncbi:hypothetical protein EVAR_102591_1 [Eumeta japonica]|uniref:Uncharacterized protein n=1 Tax=Eumeta variegata TaxID=151549 RepID=A0A4C1TUM2_EUMVA|nr:hypothetical protein EVAR_102591_1 [Eumeta japonica]